MNDDENRQHLHIMEGGVPGKMDWDDPAEDPPSPDYPELFDPSTEHEELQQEINELRQKYQQLETKNSQLMRVAADFENYKRRQQKEKEDLIKFAGERVIVNLLEILDNFERALQVEIQPDEFHQFLNGIQMIHKQFLDVIKKAGVVSIEAVGHPFDPELHEAVMAVPSDEHPDQTVLEEFQKGYLLNGKVIRHSTVKVSSET